MNINIPHQYWYIDSNLLQGHTAENLTMAPGKPTPVIVHAVQSRPGKCLMFHCLTDFGANYSGVPIHALCTDLASPINRLEHHELQAWSCFDAQPEVIVYEYLDGRTGKVRFPGREDIRGQYVFTVYWPNSPYTAQSTQYKEAHVMLLDNGQIAAMPNNRILWIDASFVTKPMPGYPLKVIHPSQWTDPEVHTKPHDDDFMQGQCKIEPTSPKESQGLTCAFSDSDEPITADGGRGKVVFRFQAEPKKHDGAHTQSHQGKAADQTQGLSPEERSMTLSWLLGRGLIQEHILTKQSPSGNAQAKETAQQPATPASAKSKPARRERQKTKPAQKKRSKAGRV